MTDSSVITINERDRVAWLTIDRPPLNIFDIATMRELSSRLSELEQRQDLAAVALSAKGRVFSAGVDVPEHKPETVREMLTSVHDAFRRLFHLPCPTVSAIHADACGGGLELAILCDCILVSDQARLGFPEISLGVFPPLAAAYLHTIVGTKLAAELILTGQPMSADRARQIGLVNHVFPQETFRESVEEFCQSLTAHSAFSLSQTKAAMRSAQFPQFNEALAATERVYLDQLMSGDDPVEGLRAFMEKRAPEWKDR
ncbi:MAG: enoyl-CoA hydratase [candidate division Zixibacteria bacterium]|nr:enoyl-CoA hydratase [candidate division Zixibacteria bacterium]